MLDLNMSGLKQTKDGENVVLVFQNPHKLSKNFV